MFASLRRLHADRLLRSVTRRSVAPSRVLSSSTHFGDLGGLTGPTASIRGDIAQGSKRNEESRHRFSGHKDQPPPSNSNNNNNTSSSFQSQPLPLGGKAFQKTLRSRLLNRNNRPLANDEDLFYMNEIRTRVRANIMTASSIVDTIGILTLFVHHYKHPLPTHFKDNHSFHALVKELIGNFIDLTMASSNDSTALMCTLTNQISRLGLQWDDLGELQQGYLEMLNRGCQRGIRFVYLTQIVADLGKMSCKWLNLDTSLKSTILHTLTTQSLMENHPPAHNKFITDDVAKTLFALSSSGMSISKNVVGSVLRERLYHQVATFLTDGVASKYYRKRHDKIFGQQKSRKVPRKATHSPSDANSASNTSGGNNGSHKQHSPNHSSHAAPSNHQYDLSMSFIEYERTLHWLHKADLWKGRKTEVPKEAERAILDRLCAYEAGDGRMTHHLQLLPAVRLLGYLADMGIRWAELSDQHAQAITTLILYILEESKPTGPHPGQSDQDPHPGGPKGDKKHTHQMLGHRGLSKKPFGEDGKTVSYHYAIMRAVHALRKMQATVSLVEPIEGYPPYDAITSSDQIAALVKDDLSLLLTEHYLLHPCTLTHLDAAGLKNMIVSVAGLVQDNYDNVQLHASSTGSDGNNNTTSTSGTDGGLSLDLDKELLLREYLRQALTRVESDLRAGSYRNKPIQIMANLLWALGSLNFAWHPSDATSVGTPGESATGIEGSIREAYLTDSVGNMILQHHALPSTFKRAVTTELSAMFSRESPNSTYPTSTTLIENEGTDPGTGTHEAVPGSGVGGGGSVLPYLQSHGLNSRLSSVQSFREFLCPAAQNMSPPDIYNWLGALVRIQLPWNDLPINFRNAVLVALAEDVPLQGASTVANVVDLLARSGFYVCDDGASERSESGEGGSTSDGTRVHPLPAFLSSLLLQRIHDTCTSMNVISLLRLLQALSVHGLCRDLSQAGKHGKVSDMLVGQITALLHNHIQNMEKIEREHGDNGGSGGSGDSGGTSSHRDVSALLEGSIDGAREAHIQALTSPQQRTRTRWYFHDIRRLLDCVSQLELYPGLGADELKRVIRMSLIKYFQRARDATSSSSSSSNDDHDHTIRSSGGGVASFEKFEHWVRTRVDGGEKVRRLLGVELRALASYEAFVNAIEERN